MRSEIDANLVVFLSGVSARIVLAKVILAKVASLSYVQFYKCEISSRTEKKHLSLERLSRS